jgi:twinkle protein
VNDYKQFGIDLGGKSGEEVATTCPKCSPSRKNKTARCLSVNTVKGVWMCHHCDWRGTLKSGEEQTGRKLYVRPTKPKAVPSTSLSEEFKRRHLSWPLAAKEGVTCVSAYMPQCEEHVECVAFPYTKQGELVNIKFRALQEKAFRQIAGAEKVLYRQDRIGRDRVVIVEGEWDALSCVEAGIDSVVSVPDGAPAPTAKNYTAKFTFLDQDPDPFADVEEIVLAVDNDEPGQVLQKELARRLGVDRCRFVVWPSGCKDANDVLKYHGKAALVECLRQTKQFPVRDVVQVGDIAEGIAARFAQAPARGLSTGWDAVNEYYTVEPGQLTVITGIPSSGKSEWLDALTLNLGLLHSWRFAVCSPENAPVELHCAKLIEKYVGRPYWPGKQDRMSLTNLNDGIQWLHDHMVFIMSEDALSIQGVIDRATSLVRRHGIQGLILDPFNEFDHTRERGMTDTEYVGHILGYLKRWARKYQVHVWLVAHPQKLYRREDGTYPIPTPYDISGSSHFRNKADNCITVWRDMDHPDTPVQIHVQKVRFKHIGKVGMAELAWDELTGRYGEPVIVTDTNPLARGAYREGVD